MSKWRIFDPDDPKWDGILVKWVPTKEELEELCAQLNERIQELVLEKLIKERNA